MARWLRRVGIALLCSLGRGGLSNLFCDVARFQTNLARPLYRPKV